MSELKEVVKAFFEPVLNAAIVRNSEDKKEEKEIAENEKVDKRDIIRQIMAIAGKEEASEDVKTIAKLAEKLAYEDSEAGTADNKKAKNTDKEEKFEEEKEIAENKKAKNEEEDKKEDNREAENKCKNSMDEIKNAIYGGCSAEIKTNYLSKDKRLELGNKY